ncbi:MAG: TonB-dependent receptor [Undibacterium sp.]|nr:TonB-dependent receptor [Undibacterium sp.]
MSIKNLKFKKTLVANALMVAFGASVLSMGISEVAFAQSNASGSIFGQANAGSVVSIQNVETGAKRNANVDSSGRFNITALPVGHYKVDLTRDGKIVSTTEVDVVLGQGSNAIFSANTQTVEVSARRIKIDVSNTNNGAIFSAKELAKLPVATNLNSIILLAPNTTRADAAFGGSSFGGSAASENAYYINGFPVTNPLSNLGSSELPFGAISQASVITGGFGAEFGRSIGGVLSVTTKSGTNKWEAGVSASITPAGLTSKTDNIYYPMTGKYDTDGKLHFRRDLNKSDAKQGAFYVGGPIITDKLFMFIAVDKTDSNRNFTNSENDTSLKINGWNDEKTANQRLLVKFDWNISDDHRLEWTTLGDETKVRTRTYGYFSNTGTHNDIKYSEKNETNATGPRNGSGSDINSLKYTGQLTNDLTITAVVGQNKAKRGTEYENYNINSILRSINSEPDAREDSLKNLYNNAQKFAGSIALPGTDTVKSYRFDLEYKLGAHTLRTGLDDIKISSTNAGVFEAGGGSWTFSRLTTDPHDPASFSVGREAILANYGGLGTKGYYATLFTFSSVTDSSAHQSAQYIEDRYQVTKNLLLTAGLRNEQYSNTSKAGNTFIDVKNQLAPRFAAAWDVNGDASLKIFGSAGRYHLPLPSQVAARAAGVSSYLF